MYNDNDAGIRADVDRVEDSATSVTLLALNAQRREAVIYNESSAALYVKFGATASATDYTVLLASGDTLQTRYRGQIDGIWASDAGGAAQVTELT